jgi:hypothetical protein
VGWRSDLDEEDKALLSDVVQDQRKQGYGVIAVVIGIVVLAPLDYLMLSSLLSGPGPWDAGPMGGRPVVEGLMSVIGSESLILVGLYVYFRKGGKALKELLK